MNSKKKRQYQKALEFNLKYASKTKSKNTKTTKPENGYTTPCKTKILRASKPDQDEVNNRAVTKLQTKNPCKISKKIKKKKQTGPHKEFKLRSDARCAERRRLRKQREMRRQEAELLEK
jgi:hypothetical protein